MGRLSRAVRAQRERRCEERRLRVVQDRVRDRLNSSLRETLCTKHNFSMRDERFFSDQKEICSMISYAAEEMEIEFNKYFPLDGASLSVLGNFKAWLWTPMGEPIRHECQQMCNFVEHCLIRCPDCRQELPEVIDLERGESSKTEKSGPVSQVCERFGKSLWKGFEPGAMTADKAMRLIETMIAVGEERIDPMELDPDVIALSPPETGRLGADCTIVRHEIVARSVAHLMTCNLV